MSKVICMVKLKVVMVKLKVALVWGGGDHGRWHLLVFEERVFSVSSTSSEYPPRLQRAFPMSLVREQWHSRVSRTRNGAVWEGLIICMVKLIYKVIFVNTKVDMVKLRFVLVWAGEGSHSRGHLLVFKQRVFSVSSTSSECPTRGQWAFPMSLVREQWRFRVTLKDAYLLPGRQM